MCCQLPALVLVNLFFGACSTKSIELKTKGGGGGLLQNWCIHVSFVCVYSLTELQNSVQKCVPS